ncbi:signal-transducing adaptor protein 2 isoform X5 [Gallus gallus]|uniref:signal-transducing adaptor protein 2 isoform X5 n=1 Tax=Gallus gallus TaxID=9031 RepID=UPI001AE9F77F|nr:signal-transducing adaptor protein 2 isoform X5 [Gallus gallus]
MAPPAHCYEGFVESCRRRWAGLRGAALCFYGAPREQQPLELLDLNELLGVQKEGGALILQLRDQKVTLKADSAQEQEMWRGFILTMAKLELPTDLELLPGHIFQMEEALRRERENRCGAQRGGAAAAPPCFFAVSRAEAEQLLERNAGGGNVVLRPGGHSHGRGFSVSTRQLRNGAAVLKHYRVVGAGDGFLVDVDAPHYCSSLDEVVQYFVEQSKGSLQPLHRHHCARLEVVEADGEGSEVMRGPCKPPPGPPPPPPPSAAPPLQSPPPLPKPTPTPRSAALQTPIREGAGSPPRTAPRPTPRRGPPLPHGHSAAAHITEELAQKLMVRRAQMED